MVPGSSRRRRHFGVLALACLAALCVAGPAHAAVVSDAGDGVFVFRAAAGEVNSVSAAFVDDSTISLTDQENTVSEDSGSCVVVTPHRVDCADTTVTPGFRIETGDRSDVVYLAPIDRPDLCFEASVDAGSSDDSLWAVSGDGCAGPEVALHGGPGNDSLQGGSLGVALYGDDGDDRMYSASLDSNSYDGGPGDDLIGGGPGQDTIDGGAGSDLLDLGSRTDPVLVDLADPSGETQEDSLTSIESVQGGSGSDTLLGSAKPETLAGGAGDDLLDGRGGPDVMIGGDDIDVVDYSERSHGVTAIADATSVSGNEDDGPLFQRDRIWDDVEDLWGTTGGDHLYGNALSNVLSGDAGNDVLEVRDGGPDTASCGSGDDRAVTDPSDKDADCEARETALQVTVVPPSPRPPRPHGSPGFPDRRPAVAWLRLPPKQTLRSALRYGFTLTVSCDEACSVDADVSLDARGAKRLGLGKPFANSIEQGSLGLHPVGPQKLSFRLHDKTLRRRMKAAGTVELVVSLFVRDGLRNASTVTRRLVLKRTGAVLLFVPKG